MHNSSYDKLTVYKLIHMIIFSLFELFDYEPNLVFSLYNWNFIYFKTEIHITLRIWSLKSIVFYFFHLRFNFNFCLVSKSNKEHKIISFFLQLFCYSFIFQIDNSFHLLALISFLQEIKRKKYNSIDKLQPHNQQARKLRKKPNSQKYSKSQKVKKKNNNSY